MKSFKTTSFTLALLSSLLLLAAFIRSGDDPIDKLTTALQKWTDSIPQEKVYLHMDKPYYAVGDTIWFKGYITIGSRHQLSALSGALYVDLINGQDSLIKALKLPVTSGMVLGDFILGDDYKEGNYRIRAYTQWMRNAGEDYFFDRAFTVGDPANFKKKYRPKIDPAQTDVQFFPESGNLINGVFSKVAVKALGADGLSIPIKGKILDNDNNEVTEFATLYAGMGSFTLKPLTGKSYNAKLTLPDGTFKTVPLPKAINDGYVLSVYQPNKDSLLVRIRTSASLQKKPVNLIVHSGGEIIISNSVKTDSASISIWLEKKYFPTGIAQFTLFNSVGEPLIERIAFIKSNDLMQLSIKSARAIYKSKEHVQIDLQARDSKNEPTFGNFSVAVINEDKVPVDESMESTIFSNILLSSDLKGYVENPNYYFTKIADTKNNETNEALDNLMLTQGYRRFVWRDLANTVNLKPTFPAENLGTVISGKVTTLRNVALAGANVMLISTKAGIMKGTTTDANGMFRFEPMFMTDSIKFAVQARTAKNSDKVIISMDNIAPVKVTGNKNIADVRLVGSYLESAIKEGKTPSLSGPHVLKQVNIKGQKIEDPGITPQGAYKIPEGSADKVITISDPENYTTLSMFLGARLPGISVEINEKTGYKELMGQRPTEDLLHLSANTPKEEGKEIGLIVNGRKITDEGEVDEILEGSILPEDIAKIELVKTNRAMVNFLHGSDEKYPMHVGYVLLLTKLGTTRKQYNPSIANISPKGFNKAREFYAPRYTLQSNATKQPDLRTTVYWNPRLQTDAKGKTSFDFYNADGPGTYKVIVEGINADGELGRQIYRYAVE